MKTRSKNATGGFTLIELLVAMAITTIIISILVSVTALSLDAWNRSRSEVRAARQGKAMIDSMARDFESFVSRKGNSFEWLYAESNPSTEGPKDDTYTSPNALDLVFFTAATDRYDGNVGDPVKDKGGDVSTVGYQLVYKDPIDSIDEEDYKTFVLYRKLVNPDDTFKDLLGQTDLKGKVASIDDKENFICENVYEFTVTFHVKVSTTSGTPPTSTTTVRTVRIPVSPASNSVKEFSVTGAGNIIITNPANQPVNGATPDEIKSAQLSAAEISLTVLTDFGLKQLRARTMNDTEKAEFIAKNSFQYSKLVQVPGS